MDHWTVVGVRLQARLLLLVGLRCSAPRARMHGCDIAADGGSDGGADDHTDSRANSCTDCGTDCGAHCGTNRFTDSSAYCDAVGEADCCTYSRTD